MAEYDAQLAQGYFQPSVMLLNYIKKKKHAKL